MGVSSQQQLSALLNARHVWTTTALVKKLDDEVMIINNVVYSASFEKDKAMFAPKTITSTD